MINVEITEEFAFQLDSQLIEQTALTTLQHESEHKDPNLTIVITNDEQIQALNKQYLDVDDPTDVLSFSADFLDPENETLYLGDIIISYPRAMKQAADGGYDVKTEIQLLVVHGVLHLLGHDHAESSEKSRMWAVQKDILHQLGHDNLKLPDGE